MPLITIIDNKKKVISMQDHLNSSWIITSTNDVLIPTIHILDILPWIIDPVGNVIMPSPNEVMEHRVNYLKFDPIFECSLCMTQNHECNIFNVSCCRNSFCTTCLYKWTRAVKNTCPYCRNEDKFIKCRKEFFSKQLNF